MHSRVWLCDSIDCSPQGSSVLGIFQERILEQVFISSSRGSSQSRDWTCVSCVSCIGRWILYHWCHLGIPFSWGGRILNCIFGPKKVHEMKRNDLPLRKFPANNLFSGVLSHLCFTQYKRQKNSPQRCPCPNLQNLWLLPCMANGSFPDVIKLRALRWGDYPGTSK